MPNLLLVADAEWVENEVAAALVDPDTTLEVVTDPRRTVAVADSTIGVDVYVVDLQVGAMGGMAVTRTLKDAMASGALEQAPIVMLLDRQADAFLAKRAGATAWLVKPFTSQDLRRVLTELLPQPVPETVSPE